MISVNVERLKIVKNKGNICLCDLKKTCPCDDFLECLVCKCGVYTNLEKTQ